MRTYWKEAEEWWVAFPITYTTYSVTTAWDGGTGKKLYWCDSIQLGYARILYQWDPQVTSATMLSVGV